MVEEARYRDVKALYYLKPGCSLSDGLVLCWDNKSFCDLIGYWLVEGEIHVYVEHNVSVPEISEAPLSLPAASIETDEGYNRNNTIDEGKDVNESHVVDEGLSNINNGVGSSEVNSEEKVEANINEVDLGSYGSDDDGEVVCKKFKKDYFDPSDKVPSFQLGMIFENSKQFKAALTKYAIAKRFDFKLSKNDRDKTRAVCKGQDCPWTIYASKDSRDEHYKLHEMIKLGKEKLKLDLTVGVCRRARELAKEEINGNYKYEFKRPFVSLDGCFLKGMLEGALQVAVGMDANNQMYPIAWALVESETKYSWRCKATSEADFRKQAAVVCEVKGRALLDMLKKDPTH
ncbi:hypothetical protein V6N13_111840 [Hibiscus sabdariffa]